MNARTNPPTSSIVVVISAGPVAASGIVIREFFVVMIAVWIERFRIGIDVAAMVNSPSGNEERSVLRDEHPFVFVIRTSLTRVADSNRD